MNERYLVRIRGLLDSLLRTTAGDVRALPPDDGSRTAQKPTGGYGMAIVLIVITYALAVTATARWMVPVLLLVQVVTVWYALRASHARRGLRIGAAGVFVLALGAGVADVLDRSGGLAAYTFLAASVLYVVAPVSITADLARRRDVGRELMLGALATFLMIGMAFAFGYRCLAALEPSPFFGDEGDGTLADSLFFSFVTLTSTGYGNLVPAGVTGQSMAVLEALLGQLFLVIAVSKIVNVWKPRGW